MDSNNEAGLCEILMKCQALPVHCQSLLQSNNLAKHLNWINWTIEFLGINQINFAFRLPFSGSRLLILSRGRKRFPAKVAHPLFLLERKLVPLRKLRVNKPASPAFYGIPVRDIESFPFLSSSLFPSPENFYHSLGNFLRIRSGVLGFYSCE